MCTLDPLLPHWLIHWVLPGATVSTKLLPPSTEAHTVISRGLLVSILNPLANTTTVSASASTNGPCWVGMVRLKRAPGSNGTVATESTDENVSQKSSVRYSAAALPCKYPAVYAAAHPDPAAEFPVRLPGTNMAMPFSAMPPHAPQCRPLSMLFHTGVPFV